MDPTVVSDCDAEGSKELQTLCLVQVAGRAGREGRAAEVDAACGAVTGFWQEECHFRGGEELARSGSAAAGLGHCAKAGKFTRFCLSHVVWGPRAINIGLEDIERLAAGFGAIEGGLPDDTSAESLLRARYWFDAFFGTGKADVERAKSADERDAPYARGAWALEAVRLTGGDLDAARKAWSAGEGMTGEPLPTDRRLGRYDLPFDIAGEARLSRIPTFGGGKRFVGETEEEDFEIALLEAAYFRESTTAVVFRSALTDGRPRVRYTAIRCFRTIPSADAEQVLSALANDPDPIIAAHVADALKFRTWEGKKNAPGLR